MADKRQQTKNGRFISVDAIGDGGGAAAEFSGNRTVLNAGDGSKCCGRLNKLTSVGETAARQFNRLLRKFDATVLRFIVRRDATPQYGELDSGSHSHLWTQRRSRHIRYEPACLENWRMPGESGSRSDLPQRRASMKVLHPPPQRYRDGC